MSSMLSRGRGSVTTQRELTRIQEFAKAVCTAWCNNCVMAESGKDACTSKNCMVYPIAAAALGRLDARDSFIHKREAMGDEVR